MKLTEKQEHVLQATTMIAISVILTVVIAVHQRITQLEEDLLQWQTWCGEWRDWAWEWEIAYNDLMFEIETEQMMESGMRDLILSHYKNIEKEKIAPDEDEWGYDFGYVVRVVGAEARGEPFDGIMAVAQCIRETSMRTGMTPEQVVKVPNQYASPVPESCTDNMETVNEACLLVFGEGETVVDDAIEYFCAVGTRSEFHDSLRYVCTIGNHNFYSSN